MKLHMWLPQCSPTTGTRHAQVSTGAFRGRKLAVDGSAAVDPGACARTSARHKRAGRAAKPPAKPPAKATACAAAAVYGLRLAPGALPGQRGSEPAAAAAMPASDAHQQALPRRQDRCRAAGGDPFAATQGAPALQAPALPDARLPAARHARQASGLQPQVTQPSCELAGASTRAEDAVPASPAVSPALSDVTLSQTPPRATATGAAAPAAGSTAESRLPAAAVPCCALTPPPQPTQQYATGPCQSRRHFATSCCDACSCSRALCFGCPAMAGGCICRAHRAGYAAIALSPANYGKDTMPCGITVTPPICRYALVKLGTEDGKLRLVTQSEARRVRRRLGDAVTSPGGNGRSRRVIADPEDGGDSQLSPSPVGGAAAAASASMQAPHGSADRQTVGYTAEPTSRGAIGSSSAQPPAAADAGADSSFSAQLNAALRAVHASDVLPAWVPAPGLCTETGLLTSQYFNSGEPAAAALVANTKMEVNHEYLNGTALPPLHRGAAGGAAADEMPQRNKGPRSRQRPATRQRKAQPPAGMTNRGRVRQRGSKRAELLCVGTLRSHLNPNCQFNSNPDPSPNPNPDPHLLRRLSQHPHCRAGLNTGQLSQT